MTHEALSVGIDDLNVDGGTCVIDAEVIATARGVTGRQFQSLELRRRSVTATFEDPVTMAVNAAIPLTSAADPDRYTLLIVATESGIDFAKPLSSYVHKYLGLSARCRHFEVKHACYGATAALRMATAWVESRPGERALVIATDMARRLFGDPAEPAEGAGAVAMSVTASPRVLTLDRASGVSTREIYDVMRPTPTREVGHPNLSLSAYLDLLEDSWEAYQGAQGARAFADLQHVLYHAPLVPLVRQGHALLVEANSPDADRGVVTESFERLVRPSLEYCQELGNLYSGCLYAGLAGLVDSASGVAPGNVVGLYSYGSGSCAEFFSGVLGPDAAATVGAHGIRGRIAARTVVDLAEYERLVIEAERSLTQPEYTPDPIASRVRAKAPGQTRRLELDHVHDHYRSYRWHQPDDERS